MKEVYRLQDFDAGPIRCVKCKRRLMMWWNAGRLDFKSCCGLIYRQEHVKTDLVIYEDENVRI
jgi:hypothetical protein